MQKMNTPNSYWNRIKKGIFKPTLFMFCIFILVAIPRLNVLGILTFAIAATLLLWFPIIALCSFIDYIFLKSIFKKYGTIDYNVQQLRKIKLIADREASFDYVMNKLKELKWIENIKGERASGFLEARTKHNCLKTMGESIRIELIELSFQETSI